MLDIAWPELIVIGGVALVAIGPKDLPKVMRALGEWAAKARRMTRDIRSAFDQLSYETEIADKLKRHEQQQKPPPATPPITPESDHERPET